MKKTKGEKEILIFIEEILPKEKIFHNYRININNLTYEIDIFIPKFKLGLEYNGLFWYSEINKDKYYHCDKVLNIKEQDINLFQIWEDDWRYKKEIIKSNIRNFTRTTKKEIQARKCVTKQINQKTGQNFLNKNHINGAGTGEGSEYYGLYFENKLVSVIQINKNGNLDRYANKLNINVKGGFNKLFKYTEQYITKAIINMDCMPIFDIYNKVMDFECYEEPKWDLLINNKRANKEEYTKDILIKKHLGTSEQSEHEITLENEMYRIYNSGFAVFKKKEY